MDTILVGLLGTTLDARQGPRRWEKWRPTPSVFQHEDLLVDRFELLYPPSHTALAEQVVRDVRSLSPDTLIGRNPLGVRDPWDFEEVYAALHDWAGEQSFDPDEHDVLVHITTGTHVQQICLFLLTEARHLPGRLLQTAPGPRYEIIDLDLSRYDRIAQRRAQQQRESTSFLKSGIETHNGAFNALIERIETVALASRAPILLTGPTGAGKTQLARRIYELRHARGRVAGLVEVNCATLRGDQAMSALFGHRRGAFTGAERDRKGLLAEADGGLLFLDEVGELGLDEQAMLLSAIETKRWLPVGADKPVRSDFQLICGTNRALTPPDFRDDLLARIDLWSFALPGLAERAEDIAPNLDYELDRFAAREGRRVRFARQARRDFLAFAATAPWPANFRDLGAAVTRMATLASEGRIDETDVAEEIARLRQGWGRHDPLRDLVGRELDRFEAVQLADVVAVCRASATLSEAGRTLFAASRQRKTSSNDADRLRKYLAKYGLAFKEL